MRRSTRQAARAANKARLSGRIICDPPKNKKIAFGDEDDYHVGDVNEQAQAQGNENSEQSHPIDTTDESGTKNKDSNENINDEDDAVEEVTGSAARASMQKSRDVERKISKESASKKKRKKKNIVVEDNTSNVETDALESDNESDEEDLLTDDFFKMVDSERASHSQKTKQEKRHKRIQQKKILLGKHTTFVVDGDYGTANAPYPINSNVEVVALGEVGDGESNETPRVHDTSATLGLAPSKAATTFARGSMSSGVSKVRSSNGSRKRKSKDEETWKRTRKLNHLGVGHRPGQAATLFVRKTK